MTNFSKIFIIPSLQEIVSTGFDNENKPIELNHFDQFERSKCFDFIKGNYESNQDLFWKQLICFINEINTPSLSRNFFLVSHHNRMRKTIFDDMIDHESDLGFANCSCIRLEYDKKWRINMIYKGFPDDTKYVYLKKGHICKRKYGIIKNLDQSIIQKYLNQIKNPNISINIIRHGNSFHNKPLDLNNRNLYNFFFRIYDSPLSPLGIYQAKKLKKYLLENNYISKEQKNIYCASILNRSQHTLLNIIPNLNKFYNLHNLNTKFNKNITTKIKEYSSIKDMINTLANFHMKIYQTNIKNDLIKLLTI